MKHKFYQSWIDYPGNDIYQVKLKGQSSILVRNKKTKQPLTPWHPGTGKEAWRLMYYIDGKKIYKHTKSTYILKEVFNKGEVIFDNVKNLDGEKWVEIPKFSRYTISNMGRVKVTNFRSSNESKLMNLRVNIGNGYLYVHLWSDTGKKHFKRISRLVANVFIPNPLHKPEADHINGNKLDNRSSNLRWTTSSENCRNAQNLNLVDYDHKKRAVYQISLAGNTLCQFNSITEAIEKVEGASKQQIAKSANKNREENKHLTNGYFWRWVHPDKKSTSGIKRSILQYTLDDEFIKSWDSCRSAGIYYKGYDGKQIQKAADGRQKSAYGFRWKYEVNQDKI